MKKTNLIISALLSVYCIASAQQNPAPEQQGAITITGATAHIGDGNLVENCTIVFENGRITAMGSGTAVKGIDH